MSSKNKNVKYSLCVIAVFIKYAWVKLLKDKNGKIILNVYRKLNKLCVDQSKFNNKLMQEWLDNNDILNYSIYNENKSG